MKIGRQGGQDVLMSFWSGSQEGPWVLFILMCETAHVGEESVVLLEARKTLKKTHQHGEVSSWHQSKSLELRGLNILDHTSQILKEGVPGVGSTHSFNTGEKWKFEGENP